MTNHLGDIQNAKAIIIFGANPAVNHPVGFRHFLKAKERNNAQIIVVDPRYTKTAAKADYYAQIRPGTDIPFMYGMLHLIFKNGWHDKRFVNDRVYGMEDVMKEAKKWTPEKTAEVTGVPAEKIIQIATVYAKSTPGTLIWAMGLTQHSIGSSNTRMAPILQLALGNMGEEGGGTNILRGHDNVQGATDMCCLSHTLPGYYGLKDGSWKYFAKSWGVDYDWIVKRFKEKKWMNAKGFTLARWYAGVLAGKTGEDKIHNAGTNLKALFVMGNGITSIAQTAKVKEALDNLELIVLADPFVNEAAVLTDKKDNVFILPAATQFETSGSVTATNRSAQWRSKVVDPMYESKPDHEIMFEVAKRLGFYDELTKGMLLKVDPKTSELKQVKEKFQWPEDATDEIARIIKTIGLTGWTAERLKKHQENWHLFDEVSLRGIGPMKREYYGLPWPVWTETHSGSPVLYDIHRPVAEGGMGFRNRFGLEHDGVNLLAGETSAPVDSKVAGGYPEITAKNIESVLGITLTEDEKKRIGANWKVDISGIIAQKCMEAGIAPYGNAKARAKVWTFPDQIPMHREPIHSPRPDLVKEYPTYADKANHYRVDTQYASRQGAKDWSKEFPINLITGRLVNLNGSGIENRASKYLAALTPEMFADINPNLAANLGIRDGDMIWIHSPEGTKIKVKARFSYSVAEDMVFLPFHFAGHFQGEDLSDKYPEGTKPYAIGESANTVTNYGYDIITQIPETKGGLCRIEKAQEV
jgi:formate dehydrogenase major subunit